MWRELLYKGVSRILYWKPPLRPAFVMYRNRVDKNYYCYTHMLCKNIWRSTVALRTAISHVYSRRTIWIYKWIICTYLIQTIFVRCSNRVLYKTARPFFPCKKSFKVRQFNYSKWHNFVEVFPVLMHFWDCESNLGVNKLSKPGEKKRTVYLPLYINLGIFRKFKLPLCNQT